MNVRGLVGRVGGLLGALATALLVACGTTGNGDAEPTLTAQMATALNSTPNPTVAVEVPAAETAGSFPDAGYEIADTADYDLRVFPAWPRPQILSDFPVVMNRCLSGASELRWRSLGGVPVDYGTMGPTPIGYAALDYDVEHNPSLLPLEDYRAAVQAAAGTYVSQGVASEGVIEIASACFQPAFRVPQGENAMVDIVARATFYEATP